MRTNLSKLVLLCVVSLLLFDCGRKRNNNSSDQDLPTPVAEQPLADSATRFRGYAELSSLIETSLMETKGAFSLAEYMGVFNSQFFGVTGIGALLGYYNPDPLNPGWRNVKPNAVGMSVYLMSFDFFALEIAQKSCGIPLEGKQLQEIALKPLVKDLFSTICASGSNLSESDARELWFALSSGLGPESDFSFWREDLKSIDPMTPVERVQFVTKVSLTAPWVLTHF